jgi:hypothetical protein
MRYQVVRLATLAILLVSASTTAYAQGGSTSSISGVVVDRGGGLVPGATVVVKNTSTGATFNATTSANGSFNVPAVNPGTYTVTVSLSGFKTAVLNDVVANAGVPATVRAVLDVGGITETVVVSGATEIVQTQASSVAATVNVKQIQSLPLTSRNVLDFVTFLPGVNTPGGNRDSTVNGLPQSAINITLDGINIQDNTLKSTDGFFTIVQPRLDAIEEVTVTSAAQDAGASGQGAVQIRFVTRSGTNTYSGSGYHYYRNDALNANTWFNIRDHVDKPELLQNQWGGRLGGPVVLPGLYDGRGRLFFFFNYEEFRQPQTITRNRTILNPRALDGWFRYNTASGVREVNVLSVAAANNQISTVDPTVAQLLGDIQTSTGTTGTVTDLTDPLLQRYTFNVDQRSLNRFPTVRVDYNVSARHRLSGTFNYHTFSSTPDTLNNRDPRFPGFPATATQTSTRINLATTLRSTIGSNLVNEVRFGSSGAPVQFFKELSPSMWSGTPVADQGGYQLDLGLDLTGASNSPTPSSRNAYTWLAEDTLNWVRGSHSLSFGGSFTQVDVWLRNQTLLPTVTFDAITSDPARAMFSSANFPGSSSGNRTDARQLYALLTGRVSSIAGNARLNEGTNQYEYLGAGVQRGRLRDLGFFAQDSWRPRSNLTLNAGLRYEVQLPFYSVNDSYSTATVADAFGVSGLAAGCDPSHVTPETCNLFKPGTLEGQPPQFVGLSKGTRAYNIDWNNVSPSVGFNWTPSAQSGVLGALMGEPGDFAIRGGFARSFQRNGMNDFTGLFNSNPGALITVNRNEGLGNLGALPVLFRDRDAGSLAPPSFPATPEYPLRDVVTGDVNVFDPKFQVPYADSYTFGVQRGISRNMAIEVRYVGTRSRQQLTTYNLNELNIHENGFLEEFQRAQGNLEANIAAGRGATFRYFGSGSGTSPLPIYLAYFTGNPGSAAEDPSKYTGSLWTNSTFVNPLARYNPQPFTAANALDADATRRANAMAAGLPVNFLVANPDALGGANIRGNGGHTDYNSLQIELRRRLSQGLQFQTSFVYGRGYLSDFYSFRVPRLNVEDVGAEGNVVRAFKMNWVYELPFGQGKRWASGLGPVMDRVVGGWQLHGNLRIQSGRLVDFGNVQLVGFNEDELWNMYKLRKDTDRHVWMLPQDVIDNTVRAFSVDATAASGYSELGPPTGRYFAPASGPDCLETISTDHGDCGVRTLVLRGPMFKEVDLSVMKVVPIKGRVRAEFRIEMLNAFNFTNFVPVTGIGDDPTDYEVTGLTGTNAARVVQLVSRISW